jgi:hypothetical protein
MALGRKEKGRPDELGRPLNFNPGGDLRSRAVTSAVSSARQGLTSVFGMGTGVTLAVRPPGNSCCLRGSCKQRNFRENLKLKEAGTTNRQFPLENIAMWKERLSLATVPILIEWLRVGKVLWLSRTAD